LNKQVHCVGKVQSPVISNMALNRTTHRCDLYG